MRGELDARDVIIARLEAEPDSLIPGLKENNDAIANLELKLIGVITELKDQENLITELGDELSKANLKLEAKDRAITAIKSGLAVKGGDKQLPLFPMEPTERVFTILVENPTQTPEQTQTPEPNPEPTDTTGTLTKRELAKHILEKLPDSDLGKTKDFEKIYNAIGDAVRDKDKKAKGKEFSRLFYLEQDYSFKFVGKIGKGNRFKLV